MHWRRSFGKLLGKFYFFIWFSGGCFFFFIDWRLFNILKTIYWFISSRNRRIWSLLNSIEVHLVVNEVGNQLNVADSKHIQIMDRFASIEQILLNMFASSSFQTKEHTKNIFSLTKYFYCSQFSSQHGIFLYFSVLLNCWIPVCLLCFVNF